MLMVQKYGGTSLADGERIRAAARRVTELARQGHSLVVVVSAQGDTTDCLLEKARELNERADPRVLDGYLAAGEQMSAGLMALAIGAMGYPAVSLTGWQAGIHTDRVFGNAEIRGVDTRRIKQELEAGKVVVVTGFQGCTEEGEITTLGRGGSDTTAVALAAFLGADRCQIYTDVDGIYDRDPRKAENAVKYDEISYEEMGALIQKGAQVLHDRSVELARRHGIRVEVLSAFTDAPGTVVGQGGAS